MNPDKTLLLVDDDEIFLFMVTHALQSVYSDYEIEVANNGIEALDAMSAQNIHAIFVDINMPLMNGFEFLDEIYKQNISKQVPVYLMTSSIDPRDKKMAEQHPIQPVFLEKPITSKKLRELLFKQNTPISQAS